MNKDVWLLAIGVILSVIYVLYEILQIKKRKRAVDAIVNTLKSMSDVDFHEAIDKTINLNLVLAVRKAVSDVFEIPYDKVCPSLVFKDLESIHKTGGDVLKALSVIGFWKSPLKQTDGDKLAGDCTIRDVVYMVAEHNKPIG